MPNNAKRRKVVLTLQQKYNALKELDGGKSRSYVMDQYNVKKNTLSNWVADKAKIYERFGNGSLLSSTKSLRKCHWEKLMMPCLSAYAKLGKIIYL